MGVMPASDLFQARMVHNFAPMKSLRPFPYIDDVLHFKGPTFEEHLAILDEILRQIGQRAASQHREESILSGIRGVLRVPTKTDGV